MLHYDKTWVIFANFNAEDGKIKRLRSFDLFIVLSVIEFVDQKFISLWNFD